MPKSATRKLSPEQIIAAARRPEKKVTVCLRADLADQIAELDEELVELGRDKPDRRLGDPAVSAEEKALAERIRALEVEADEHSLELTIRALPRNEWRAAKAKFPASEDDKANGWLVDVDDLAQGTLVASVVSPDVDAEVLTDMCENLSEGQWQKVRDAILTVNGGDGSVPFSERASLIRRLSSSGDGSPEPTESASNGSTDGPRARSRRSPSGDTDSPPVG